MISIRKVSHTEEFAALGQAWNGLLRRTAQNNPFLSHEWLYSWWLAFGGKAQLHVLLCTEGEELVGIFPGYVRRDSWLPPTRRLRLLGSEVVTSDFLDVIAAPERNHDVVQAVLAHLRHDESAHLLELTDIRADSPLLAILGAPPFGIDWRVQLWPTHKLCPFIALPAVWDEFLAGLSHSARKNFQYYNRRLQSQGASLEIVRTPEELPAALADFRRLHDCRRSQKEQAGIFATPSRRYFYSEALKRFAAAGWLEMAFLKVGGVRIAGVCQFDYGNAIYYYQTGYDVAWEKSSVGFVLNGLLIERAIAAGKASFEFLRGEEAYKYRLGAMRNRCLQDVYLKHDRFLGELFLARRKLTNGCKGLARRILRGTPPLVAALQLVRRG